MAKRWVGGWIDQKSADTLDAVARQRGYSVRRDALRYAIQTAAAASGVDVNQAAGSVPREGRGRRVSVYVGEFADEMRAEADRLGITLSDVVRLAWKLSRDVGDEGAQVSA